MTATREPSADQDAPLHGSEALRLVGADVEVPLVTGGTTRYVNLDYAASAPALQAVHDAVEELLGWYSSVHRGAGFKSRASTAAYEGARESIRRFVNGRDDDAVIITRNTTDSINLVAEALAPTLAPGDEIVVTEMEHHSNIVPWQIAARGRGAAVRAVPLVGDGVLDLDALDRLLGDRARVVAVTHVSNVLGTINPVAEVVRRARRVGAVTVVDGAQAAPHMPLDMSALGCDFYAFSGHKMLGPTGIGVLYGREAALTRLEPPRGADVDPGRQGAGSVERAIQRQFRRRAARVPARDAASRDPQLRGRGRRDRYG